MADGNRTRKQRRGPTGDTEGRREPRARGGGGRRDPRSDAGREDDARDRDPGPGEQTGEAVGGVGGTLVGAGLGSAAGPIGSIIGGIAGALGGWWAGEKAGRALEDMSEHEAHYREHFAARPRPDLGFEDARIGYGVGHAAGRNPDWRGHHFEDVEPHLRDNWTCREHDYRTMRPFVRAGYLRTATSV